MTRPPISDSRQRVFWAAVLVFILLVTVLSLRSSLTWIGQPFPGFLMAPNRIVLSAGPPEWSGARADVPIGSELVAIDGRDVHSFEDVVTAARAAAPGSVLLFTFRAGGAVADYPLAVTTLTLRDYFAIFVNPFFGGLVFLVMGFTVVFLRPAAHDARALVLVALSYGFDLILRLDLFAGGQLHLVHAVTRALAPVALVYLGLAFPTASPHIERKTWRRIAVLFVGGGVLADLVVYESRPQAWFVVHAANDFLTALALTVAAVLFAGHYLVGTDGVGREKLRLVGLGAAVSFLFPSLASFVGEVIGTPFPEEAGTVLTWAFPASLALAIVKRSALEVGVVLRRALVYASLTTAVVVSYAAIVATVTVFSRGVTALDSPWFTLFYSLGVLLFFRPLWELLQSWIDRLFFRSHFDLAATVGAVSQALARPLRAEEISAQLRHVATRAFAPQFVRLYAPGDASGTMHALDGARSTLSLNEQTMRAIASGQIFAGADLALAGNHSVDRGALLVPLRFEGRLEGILMIGPKRSGAAFGPRDLELLRILANQGAMALRNAAAFARVTDVLTSLDSRVAERTRALQDAQRELTQSNRRLRELDQLKTRFFADASHELRTPLTLVIGPLEELRRRAGALPVDAVRLVELAHSNAARLLVLTDTLLDLSRLDAGRMEPRLRPEDLARIVEQTVEPFRWLAQQKGISLDVSGLESSVAVCCDAAMIAKVVGNLLANAVKFTQAGRVRVDLHCEGGDAVLSVSDTGAGIADSELPHIFERYRQASSAGQTTSSGSGIGLALVQELVTLHDGTVEVTSTPGRGSTFTVRLPSSSLPTAEAPPTLPAVSLGAIAAAVGTEPAAASDAVAPDGAESVLVVDDNANLREFLHQLLSPRYRVAVAADAESALAAIRGNKPDLIVSDVMMPGRDGVALCKIIRDDPQWCRIPVILLTARAALEAKLAALDAGADDYVTKPFHADELLARVAGLLRARRTERELERSHAELRLAYEQLHDTQAQLVQSEKLAALGTLVAGMAHEINNPVSFISSGIELIVDSVDELSRILDRELSADASPAMADLLRRLHDRGPLEQMRQNAAICRDGVVRATRIVTDLRTFGRPATGIKRLANLHESLDRTLRLLHGEYADRIAIDRRYGDLPLVPCDESQLSQVFLNLLINALQAIEGSGTVTLRTGTEAGMAVIEISDTGRGMDERTLARVFDPFFTTRESGGGTGLGLSVSRSILQAHGGEIRARSTPGAGSTFCVRLPLNEAPAEIVPSNTIH